MKTFFKHALTALIIFALGFGFCVFYIKVTTLPVVTRSVEAMVFNRPSVVRIIDRDGRQVPLGSKRANEILNLERYDSEFSE